MHRIIGLIVAVLAAIGALLVPNKCAEFITASMVIFLTLQIETLIDEVRKLNAKGK